MLTTPVSSHKISYDPFCHMPDNLIGFTCSLLLYLTSHSIFDIFIILISHVIFIFSVFLNLFPLLFSLFQLYFFSPFHFGHFILDKFCGFTTHRKSRTSGLLVLCAGICVWMMAVMVMIDAAAAGITVYVFW